MSTAIYQTAAFGSSKAGLGTVGYALYNADGTANGSRITAGIQDLAGGQYGALVTFPDGFGGRITWDTGGGSPVYASDGAPQVVPTAAQIADTTHRRTHANIEASSDGDALSLHSSYGMQRMAQSQIIAGTTGTVKKTDGTTLGTVTYTDTPGAYPITGVS